MSQNPNVIVIDALKQEQKKLKVCAYIRVSTNSEDQLNSFKTQFDYYHEYIAANDSWEFVDIYADEGISGTSAAKRHELQRLLADCRNKKIDRVFIKSLSRFARNTCESLEMIRELRSLGVSIIFEKENIDTAKATDEFLLTLYSQIAQEESISHSNNMKKSFRSRMEQGKNVTSCAPYGYDNINGDLVINEKEAKVVQYVFDSYLNGSNMHEIADELLKQDVKNKRGIASWNHSAIRYLLGNEKYIGDSLLQKTYTAEIGKRSIVNTGELQKYYVKNSHEAIIDREIFEKVKALQVRKNKCINKTTKQSIYSRKIICNKCGSVFKLRKSRGINYRICCKHDKDRTLCSVNRIRESFFDEAFVRMYNKLQMNKEVLIQPVIDVLSEMRTKRNVNHGRVSEINKETADLLEQLKVLNELKTNKYIDSALFISQSDEINKQLKDLKEEKNQYMGNDDNNMISNSKALLNLLYDMPEHLVKFDGVIFLQIVKKIIVVSETEIKFKLINQLEFTEHIERIYR